MQAAPQQPQQQQQQQNGGGSYADQWQFKPGFAQTKETDEWWWVALVVLGWALYILLWITIIATILFFEFMIAFFAICGNYYYY